MSELTEWVNTLIEGWPLSEIFRTPIFEGLSGYGIGPDLDLRHYLGYVDDTPVMTSSLMLAAGVAGVYSVVTRPEFRGMGLGAMITLRHCWKRVSWATGSGFYKHQLWAIPFINDWVLKICLPIWSIGGRRHQTTDSAS